MNRNQEGTSIQLGQEIQQVKLAKDQEKTPSTYYSSTSSEPTTIQYIHYPPFAIDVLDNSVRRKLLRNNALYGGSLGYVDGLMEERLIRWRPSIAQHNIEILLSDHHPYQQNIMTTNIKTAPIIELVEAIPAPPPEIFWTVESIENQFETSTLSTFQAIPFAEKDLAEYVQIEPSPIEPWWEIWWSAIFRTCH